MDVLLYSKFSNASKKLKLQLDKSPDILQAVQMICIDNIKVRQQILNDKKIKVSLLPCLIRLNDETNNFDVYEGENAFDFFSNIQERILEHSRAEKLRMEEFRLQQLREEQMIAKTKIEEKPVKAVSFTPIDELEEEKGISTYIHIEKNGKDEERDINTKHAESVVKSSSGSLLSKAMRLQKERDAKD